MSGDGQMKDRETAWWVTLSLHSSDLAPRGLARQLVRRPVPSAARSPSPGPRPRGRPRLPASLPPPAPASRQAGLQDTARRFPQPTAQDSRLPGPPRNDP